MGMKKRMRRKAKRWARRWAMPVGATLFVLFLALLIALPVRSADNDTINVKVPVDATVTNPCAEAERVRLTGDVHVVLKKKANGERVSYSGQVNAAGIKGTGTPSGRSYTASGSGKITTDEEALPADFFVTGRFRLISKGSAENLHGQATVKISVNADGSHAATTQSLSLECK